MSDFIAEQLAQPDDKCICEDSISGGDDIYFLWDADHNPVLGIDTENATLNVRVYPEKGLVGVAINYCPFCGRKLTVEETSNDE